MSIEFNSYNQNITCFRGDTGSLTIRLKVSTFLDGDSVVMTVSKNGVELFPPRIVTVFINDNKDAVITLLPEHTNNNAGVYKYSIIYNTVDGQVHHIVPNICDGTNPTFKICEV